MTTDLTREQAEALCLDLMQALWPQPYSEGTMTDDGATLPPETVEPFEPAPAEDIEDVDRRLAAQQALGPNKRLTGSGLGALPNGS